MSVYFAFGVALAIVFLLRVRKVAPFIMDGEKLKDDTPTYIKNIVKRVRSFGVRHAIPERDLKSAYIGFAFCSVLIIPLVWWLIVLAVVVAKVLGYKNDQ